MGVIVHTYCGNILYIVIYTMGYILYLLHIECMSGATKLIVDTMYSFVYGRRIYGIATAVAS